MSVGDLPWLYTENHMAMSIGRLLGMPSGRNFAEWVFKPINFLEEVLILQQNYQQNEVVTGKTLFFPIGLFCNPHSICFSIIFWQRNFVWKCYFFSFSAFN